jgi:pimeloyl-ACP methyl ester carboxylesterase
MSQLYAREFLMVQTEGAMQQVAVHTCLPEKSPATVFCIHDFFGNGRDFLPLMDMLSAEGYRVVAPDLLGRGDSAYLPEPRAYRPLALFRIFAAILQHYGHGRITLIGTGWGGVMLLLFLRHARFDMRRFVLVDPPMTLSLDNLDASRPLHFPDLHTAHAALAASDEFADLPRSVADGFADNRLRRDASGVRLYVDPQIVTAVSRLKQRSEQQVKLTDLLPLVTVPLLVLNGRPLPEPDKAALDLAFANRDGAIINGLGTGHRVHFTEPVERLTLLGFLRARFRPLPATHPAPDAEAPPEPDA